jgi:hypothetical protein
VKPFAQAELPPPQIRTEIRCQFFVNRGHKFVHPFKKGLSSIKSMQNRGIFGTAHQLLGLPPPPHPPKNLPRFGSEKLTNGAATCAAETCGGGGARSSHSAVVKIKQWGAANAELGVVIVFDMNTRGVAGLLRPLFRSLSMVGSSAVGSRSKLLSPPTAAIPNLSRSPLPALRNMPVLQRVWVSSYLQAVRMQRMALREGAATSKEPGAAAPKSGLDFFSKFSGASAADVPAKASLDTEASDLGSREDRPLFVTTVDAAKRRRIPWYCSRVLFPC